MRLARRALFAALAMLVLCALASAQTLRQENDPRNISPTVGTGGNPGGPTGLFTIYDGETLRRGEFTFSIAYSNYDRDPGNVDITEVPVSFQIGLNDHLELFFNTDVYRGIKVNNPQNLSGFYLPNSQLTLGTSAPAIILAPSGPNVGTLAGTALFRPAGNQPFVQFPYVGGSAGTFGLTAGQVGQQFGFPGFNATLGPPVSTDASRWHGADNFPGIGSPVGGILPGIVLATQALPCTVLTGACTGTNTTGTIIVPASYTVDPSYLPDAPFINRRYGESAFNTFTFGAKWRLTGPKSPLGVAVVPFYRFYADKANDLSGFNQLQRGSSPGGNFGDIGAIFVVSGRLAKSVNLTANGGYIFNSSPKGQFSNGEFFLLDRPNELLTGVGFDFPVNKHFQPMAELRSTWYVSAHTKNALPQNPLDLLAGVKIYPKRWFGFAAWWRYNLNQQNLSHINAQDFNRQVINVTGVNVPGRGVVVVPATSVAATAGGFPRGFIPSDDPNGFGFQIFAGRRNARAPEYLPNQPPTVTLSASSATVTQPCQPGYISKTCQNPPQSVTLAANASDPDGDTLLYTYSTTGGRVTGEGANATWDLAGVQPGTYTATVEVDDGCGCVAFSSTTVTVAACADCVPPCPTITVDCPTTAVQPGSPATVTVNLSGGAPGLTPTYNWSVSDGTIASGQGTPSITVDTTGQAGKNITATVQIGGLDPSCQNTASCSFSVVAPPPQCTKFDEYGNIAFNDEKARLDNYAIQLQNDPSSTGYIIAYADRTGPAGQAQARADRAKAYLVNTRGIDASRLTTIDGGCRETLTVELFVCPAGATAPAASNTVPCEPGPAKRARPRRPGRRRTRAASGSEE
jgi:hypothetical protein